MRDGRIEAAIANYRTADLTSMAVWSLRSAYPALPITIVDNGATDSTSRRLGELAGAAKRVTIIERTDNLHHGPSLDLVLRQSSADWVLIFDSDCILFRRGLLEAMCEYTGPDDMYMIGEVLEIDDLGYRLPASGPGADDGSHRYVHPRCALVRRSAYGRFPPFDKHGAPCLANEIAAARSGMRLVDFPVQDFVYHIGRGTVTRHGYALGLKGKLHRLRHYWRVFRQ